MAEIYSRQRDCLWENLSGWLRDGGAIPTDDKLAKELGMEDYIDKTADLNIVVAKVRELLEKR